MEPVYCKEMIAVTAPPGGFLLLGAPGIAGRSHATTLAGVRDQEIMLTLVAVGASEAVGEECRIRNSGETSARHGLAVIDRPLRWRVPARFRGGFGPFDTTTSARSGSWGVGAAH